MAEFRDLKSFFNYVEKNMKFALQEVAYEIEEIIKNYIIERLYNTYTPSSYTRTYDYINSLTVDKVEFTDDGYQVFIYFDTKKIRPLPPDEVGRWSRHQSITDGTDVSDLIPYFIEYGTHGSLWDREGIYAIENIEKELLQTKLHLKKIVSILQSRGFNVKIVNR